MPHDDGGVLQNSPPPACLHPPGVCPFGQSNIQSLGGAISAGANAPEITTGTEEQRNTGVKNRRLFEQHAPRTAAARKLGPARRVRLRPADTAWSSIGRGRRPALHAPPPWSAARGQDRETRELLLLPALRAADSCFQSGPAPPASSTDGSARVPQACPQRRVGHGDAAAESNPPEHARGSRTEPPGGPPRVRPHHPSSRALGRAGRAPSSHAAGRLPLPPPLYCATSPARRGAERAASLSPRGVLFISTRHVPTITGGHPSATRRRRRIGHRGVE